MLAYCNKYKGRIIVGLILLQLIIAYIANIDLQTSLGPSDYFSNYIDSSNILFSTSPFFSTLSSLIITLIITAIIVFGVLRMFFRALHLHFIINMFDSLLNLFIPECSEKEAQRRIEAVIFGFVLFLTGLATYNIYYSISFWWEHDYSYTYTTETTNDVETIVSLVNIQSNKSTPFANPYNTAFYAIRKIEGVGNDNVPEWRHEIDPKVKVTNTASFYDIKGIEPKYNFFEVLRKNPNGKELLVAALKRLEWKTRNDQGFKRRTYLGWPEKD